MQNNPHPQRGGLGGVVFLLVFALAVGALATVGPVLLSLLVLFVVFLGMLLEDIAKTFGMLVEEIAGGQFMLMASVALGWAATWRKAYAPLVGIAAGTVVALLAPIALQPSTWWLAPMTVLGASILLREGRHTTAGALAIAGLLAAAVGYTPIPKDELVWNAGQFFAIAGTVVAFVLPGVRDGRYHHTTFMIMAGFATLIYGQDAVLNPIVWDAVLRPVALAGLVFLAVGVFGTRAVFHLRGGTQPMGTAGHTLGALLALCAVALVGWHEGANPSGFATPGWTLLLIGSLLLWTTRPPQFGRGWQPDGRVLIATCLLALIIANPPQGKIIEMAILFAILGFLARPAWSLVFLGAAVVAAWASGSFMPWLPIVVCAGFGWIKSFQQNAPHTTTPYGDWDEVRQPFQGAAHHYPIVMTVALMGLAWTLAPLAGLPSPPAALLALGLALALRRPLTESARRTGEDLAVLVRERRANRHLVPERPSDPGKIFLQIVLILVIGVALMFVLTAARM